jgi:hypothetical protein
VVVAVADQQLTVVPVAESLEQTHQVVHHPPLLQFKVMQVLVVTVVHLGVVAVAVARAAQE